jgi:hypothetical protein
MILLCGLKQLVQGERPYNFAHASQLHKQLTLAVQICSMYCIGHIACSLLQPCCMLCTCVSRDELTSALKAASKANAEAVAGYDYGTPRVESQ